jgi:hypothetical protein
MASASPALEGSGSQQETPVAQSRFVIPSPIDDCDDVPSPSQHRLSRASRRRQACLDRMSDDQDHDDGTHSEDDEEDAEASNSCGGEEEQEEEEEEEESEDYDEEEQDGDASEAATSCAPSKQPSSHNQLEKLVLNLQKEVAYLQAHSWTPPVDALSVPTLNKRQRLLSPDVVEDEEAPNFFDLFVSDHGYETDSVWESVKSPTQRKRVQPKFLFIASWYLD